MVEIIPRCPTCVFQTTDTVPESLTDLARSPTWQTFTLFSWKMWHVTTIQIWKSPTCSFSSPGMCKPSFFQCIFPLYKRSCLMSLCVRVFILFPVVVKKLSTTDNISEQEHGKQPSPPECPVWLHDTRTVCSQQQRSRWGQDGGKWVGNVTQMVQRCKRAKLKGQNGEMFVLWF